MKKALSILLSLVMCLSLLPVTAFAAEEIPAPTNPKAALDDDVPGEAMDFTDEIIISFGTPDTLRAMLENGEIHNITVQMDWSVNSEDDWKCSGVDDWKVTGKDDWGEYQYGKEIKNIIAGEIVEQIGTFRSNYNEPAQGGYADICHGIDDIGNGWLDLENNTIYMKLRFFAHAPDDQTLYSDWTEVFTIGKEVDKEEFEASDWAQAELAKADELGLIPEVLEGADLTQSITRAEFAAVSVKAYEALANTTALPAVVNPFTDTNDAEVLKAYNTGITAGVSATEFAPNDLLNREQAATMLTRVFKRATVPAWTLATDGQFPLTYEKPEAFADDADISDWAKDSVYFMAANGIINGVGSNKFAPKNVTSEEEANGYANATREQALIIAVRMVENLK